MPQPPTPAREPEIHERRQVAESFGADAERYDRTQPPYPSALVQRIVAASPGPDVLDVGCGTGTAARQFQAVGCRVLGVDPDARMAEFARHSGTQVEVSTFEAWDSAGREFDAIIADTAWRWVDPVAGGGQGGAGAAGWRPPRAVPSCVPDTARTLGRLIRPTGRWRRTRRSTSSR